MKSFKNKIMLAISIFLSLSITLGVALLFKNYDNVYAEENYFMAVEKYSLPVDNNLPDFENIFNNYADKDNINGYYIFDSVNGNIEITDFSAVNAENWTNLFIKFDIPETENTEDTIDINIVDFLREASNLQFESYKPELVQTLATNQASLKTNNIAMLKTSNNGYKEFIITSFMPAGLHATLSVQEIEDETTYTWSYVGTNAGSTNFQTLTVSANLNNIDIKAQNQYQSLTSSKKYYTFATDLSNIVASDKSDAYNKYDAQGHYTYEFTFTDNEGASSSFKPKAEFYVLDENYYTNASTINGTAKIQPILYNVTKTDRDADQINFQKRDKKEYDYFNYNNNQTINYNGNENQSTDFANKILYPTVTYDPTKYNLSYYFVDRSLDSVSLDIVTSELVYVDENNLKVVLSNGKEFTATKSTNEIDGYANIIYQVDVRFEDLGNYVLQFDFALNKVENGQITNYLPAGNINNNSSLERDENWDSIREENYKLIGTDDLTIFGYQLFYSVYDTSGNTNAELKNIEKNLYADVTNANTNLSITSNAQTYENIPSTNQPPLFFKYGENQTLTSITFNRYSKKGDATPKETKTVDNIYRFASSGIESSDNGYYEVYVSYNHNGVSYFQIFAFEVKYTSPSVSFKTINGENETDWTGVGYTNKKVKIDWSESLTDQSPFDISPSITLTSDSKVNAIIEIDEENGFAYASVKDNTFATFKFKIEWGPINSNRPSKTYTFTIDTTPLDNYIKLYVLNDGNVDEFDNLITKNPLRVVYGTNIDNIDNLPNLKKASGADITMTYDILQMSIPNNPTVEYLQDLYAITNKYQINSVLSNNNYEPYTKAGDNNGYSLNYLPNINAIFILNFVDDAGNTFSKAIVTDFTSPKMMYRIIDKNGNFEDWQELTNANNYLKTNAEVNFGQYKAIKVDSNIIDNLVNFATSGDVCIKNDSTNNYLLVKIDKKSIKIGNEEKTTNNQIETITADKELSYEFTSKDIVKNSAMGKIIVNFDNVELKALMYGDHPKNIQNIGDLNFSSDDNTPDSNNNDIADGDITTLQHLKLQWLANDEKFIVKKVEYEYYPFDFNTIFINDNNNYNPNYPFSISPQFSEILFEGNTGTGELNGDCFVTNYINLSTGNKDFSGGTATKQGMYVVTRTYDHDKFVQAVQEKLNNGETELDTEVRKYYFYIDRNNIITQINDRLVTNNISILMGSGDDQSSFADLEFFNDILNAKGNIFETNKQPIELNIPLTKYKTYGQTFEGFVYNYNTTTTSYDYTSYKFFFMPNATGKYTNGNATIYIKNQSNNDTQTYNCTYVVRTENAVPTIVITYGNNNQITATFTNGNAINNSIALNATIGEYNVYAKKQTQNMIYYNYSINNNLVNESFAGSKTTNNAIAKLDKNTLTYELHVSDISPEFVGGDTSRSFKNNYYNSLIFQYEINLKNPTAKFVDSSGFQTSENQNSTDVKLIWNKYDPYFDFNANIDANNISITKQTYTNGQIFTSVIPNFRATSTESVAYIYFSDIEVPTESTKYIVTLQYKNASYYGEFSKSTNTLNVDLNAPYYNYSNLFYNDSFLQQLSSSEIANFKNYSADINFENYAFVVEEGWELKIPTASDIYSENSRIIYDKLFVDSSDLDALDKYDVAYAWYRAYDKAYTGTNPEYMQSIVPGDDRYYDRSVPNYKFDANLTNEQNEKIYSQYLFGTTILSAGSYYEIIEKDISGNYRVYTIYVTDQNVRTITFELDEGYTIEKMTDDNTYLVTTTNMDASINQVNIADQTEINSLVSSPLIIKSIDGLGAYYDVTIQNLATKGNVVQIRKSKASDILTQINSAISTNFNYGKEGNNFKITFYSASGTYVVNYRTESELDIIFNSSTCTLTFTVDKTYGSYIKTLQVLQNGIRVYTIGENDTNKPYTITTSSTSTKTTYMLRFDLNQNMGSQLKFTFTDNFDKFNQRFVVLGIENTSFDYVDSDTTGSNMLIFGNDHTSTDYDKIENPTPITTLEYDEFTKVSEFYTGLDTVSFRYQTRVYSNVKFYEYKNETLTELKNLRSSTSNTNYKNITQLFNNKKENVDDVYVITFIDPVGNVYEYIIHHYTKLADITFEDVDNNAVDFEEQAVPQLTKIYTMYVENQPEKYQTTITATRNSVSNGMSWTTNLGTIRSGYAFSVTGTYVVTAKNSIGTTKTFIFSYTETDNYFYTITANANGVTRIIYPSSNLKFNYNGNLIDQYFALNSETISISVGNDYEFEEIASMTSNSTKIYQLTSKTVVSFSKLFAITQIRSTTDLLLGKFYIDNKQVSASKISAQSISEIVTITIPSYYSDKTNKLVLSVTYNNKLIGKINGVLSPDEEYMTYSFDVAGDYTISVSDQAGNIHLFNGTTQKFALSVLNDVIYKINSKDPIKNSYYNSSVILNVLSINKFYADKNQPYVTESVTLNNVQIDTTRYNKINNGTYYTYTFDEYGSYVVTFTAYIGSVAEQNKVSTTATFTIINPNEAKRVHEYIGLNGYQVNSIIKDNVDVTNVIKNKIGTATLNQFALFGGTGNNVIGGNGRYTITVNAYLGNILGYQEFTYSVWINDDTSALIESSIQPGSSTTKTIYLKMNLYQIYSKIGDCTIKLNGKKYITINSSTASSNTISTYELKSNQKYNITVETESGNTLLSFVVTKKEPLNTVAIIVIVVVSVVATGLTVTFILFRKRMRVK